MILKKIKWILLLVFISSFAYAQKPDDVADSMQLDEITIMGSPYKKYAAGAKIQTIDSITLQQFQHGTLADLLEQQSAIYMKKYGNGMLSSISFRGTGASHTAILWNGINLNSLTLGNLDFALVPVFSQEEVEIQYGSSSSLYGSDAIGGAIYLSNSPTWGKGLKLGVQQDIGSFDTYFTGVDLNWSDAKWSSQSKVYHKSAQNDFSFQNNLVFQKPEQRQLNAAYQYYGVLQNLNYKINNQQYLSLSGWFNFNDRQIQPTMPSNDQRFQNSFTEIQDQNIRVVGQYNNHSSLGYFNVKLGYVHDYQLFDELSKIATSRTFSSLKFEKELFQFLDVNIGANWNHIWTDVDSYERTITENRNDVYALFNFNLLPIWRLSVNIRQAFIENFKAPMTPSLGSDLTLLQKNNHLLNFKTVVARGYRVPTLNDRYWPRSGNLNLSPENSLSGDVGFSYQYNNRKNQFSLEGTYYQMKIDDMITWLPSGSIWRPKNVQEAEINGIEATTNFKTNLWQMKLKTALNYTWTNARNTIGVEGQSVNNQLPYTARHMGNISQQFQYHNWWLNMNFNYTGERFVTTDNRQKLDDFLLTDIQFGPKISFNKDFLDVRLKINNVFDVDYQNVQYQAMPGINYHLSLSFHYN